MMVSNILSLFSSSVEHTHRVNSHLKLIFFRSYYIYVNWEMRRRLLYTSLIQDLPECSLIILLAFYLNYCPYRSMKRSDPKVDQRR